MTKTNPTNPYVAYAARRPFRNRCYICHAKYRPGKGFAFHHKVYGQKSYRDFPSKSGYTDFLFEEIDAAPSNFALLCKKHHFAVELGKRWKRDNFKRYAKLTVQSMGAEL